METTLKIFCNYTPNRQGIYYAPTATSKGKQFNNILLNHMIEEAEAEDLELITKTGNTFKIYNEYIDIDPTEITDPWVISYIALISGDNVVFEHVDRVNITSSGIRLFTSLDNWGNYIGIATIDNVTVFKTNRILDNNPFSIYTYDQLKAPSEGGQKRYYSKDTYTVNNLAVYAVVNYEALKNSSQSVDSSALICVPLSKYAAQYHPEQETPTATIEDVFKVIEEVSNISEIQFKDTQNYKKFPATTSKVYLDIFNENIVSDTGLYISTLQDGSQPHTLFNTVKYKTVEDTFYIKETSFNGTFPAGLSAKVLTINALTGYKVSAGVYGNMLELPPFIGYEGITVKKVYSYTGITISIEANNNTLDLTANFEVQTTINHGTLTAQERTQKTLSTMAGVVGGGAQILSAASGNVTGAISGGLSLANTFANLKRNERGAVLPVGDALSTFGGILNTVNIGIPAAPILIGVAVEPILYNNDLEQNEQIRFINNNGANCSKYLRMPNAAISDLNGKTPLFNSSIAGSAYYYIYQLNCTISQIPGVAADAIRDILKEGAKLIFI